MPSKLEVIKLKRLNDPEYAERSRAYGRVYRDKNLERERERKRVGAAKKRSEDRESYNAYMREWNAQNKERINAERREKRANNPERTALDNARRREHHRANPIKHRDTMLRNNYGITIDDYRRMYAEQNGNCAICGKHCPDHGKSGLVVDHCHTNGNVRKLLCAFCNKALGLFFDDTELLDKAKDYLNKHRKD